MKHQPIPPFTPETTQPTGIIAAKSFDIKQLRDDLRSPKLPVFQRSTVIVTPRNTVVRGWGS